MTKKRAAIDQIEFMRNLLAFLLVGAFIAMLPMFALIVIPDQNKDVITYMVGQLSGMAITVLGFYFVSKVGQDALDATRSENTGKLADLANNALNNNKRPDGTQDDPLKTEVINTPENPAFVKESEEDVEKS